VTVAHNTMEVRVRQRVDDPQRQRRRPHAGVTTRTNMDRTTQQQLQGVESFLPQTDDTDDVGVSIVLLPLEQQQQQLLFPSVSSNTAQQQTGHAAGRVWDTSSHLHSGSVLDGFWSTIRNNSYSATDFLWMYTTVLGVSLVAWVLYLLIPKGARIPRRKTMIWKTFKRNDSNGMHKQREKPTESFLARFKKRHLNDNSTADTSFASNNNPLNVSLPNQQRSLEEDERGLLPANFSTAEHEKRRRRLLRAEAAAAQAAANESQRLAKISAAVAETRESPPRSTPSYNNPTSAPPPTTTTTTPTRRYFQSRLHTAVPDAETVTLTPTKHPSQSHRVPAIGILQETLKRLQGRGIRLTAHGVQTSAKRVWIRYDTDCTTLQWQTEVLAKTATGNNNNDGAMTLVRGVLHNIPMANVMYIDVGKKTTALMKVPDAAVPATTCFSLLTATGSLDLQANSKLERDALVSCFSLLLDQVHESDWRRLYEETSSSTATGAASSSLAPSHVSSTDVVMMGKPRKYDSPPVAGSGVSLFSVGLSDI
jgi:hypothetical protein